MRRRGSIKRRRPDRIAKLLLYEPLLSTLEDHLRTTGLDHREEAGLIAGYVVGSVGVATTAVLPYTQNTTAACALPVEVTISCFETIRHAGQIVLAQVHTHPGRACHSATDDDWAISDCSGLFSIVVPCFGRYGIRKVWNSGVAVFERMVSGRWRRLPSREVRERFLLLPSYQVVLE